VVGANSSHSAGVAGGRWFAAGEAEIAVARDGAAPG
jgi:hypothetical protein